MSSHIGAVATLASGLPYNIVTGSTNSGDTRATTDRPVINGAVIGRNAGRGDAIYDFSPFLERPISFTEGVRLDLRVEAFNVFNHPNFVGCSRTYGNGPTPGAGFGEPFGRNHQSTAGASASIPGEIDVLIGPD
jgi:hypothetical protein